MAAANNLNARRVAVGIDFTDATQVFDRVQRDKRCFMETSYIKGMVGDVHTVMEDHTKNVLEKWISLLGDALYLREAGLVGPHLQGARGEYRRDFREIDRDALLTGEQKQAIKNDYLLILSYLRNNNGNNNNNENNGNNNNNNNNNNARTINNDDVAGFYNNNGRESTVSLLSNPNNANRGGYRRKQKTHRMKKTKKQTRSDPSKQTLY
jgi:hypothetical protein